MTGSTRRYLAYSIIVLILLILAVSSVTIVRSGYIGVVTTLGKVSGERQPGLSFKWPIIQSVTHMNVQVQKDQTDQTAATNDLQDVTTTVAVNYHLDHSQVDNVFVNLSTRYADTVISPTVSEAVKSVTAKYSAGELLAKRPEVTDSVTKILINRLQPRGIVIDQFSIINFKFSGQFTQAIEGKQAAQQNAEKAQFTLQEAQLNAQANQVQQSALTDQILEQQAIAKWDGHLPQYVGQGSVFNIPLNK